MNIKDISLEKFYSNSEHVKWHTQQELESNSPNYYNADQHEADCEYAFKVAKAEATKKLKLDGNPIGMLDDLSLLECKDEFRAYLNSKVLTRKFKHMLNVIIGRLQTTKNMTSNVDKMVRG